MSNKLITAQWLERKGQEMWDQQDQMWMRLERRRNPPPKPHLRKSPSGFWVCHLGSPAQTIPTELVGFGVCPEQAYWHWKTKMARTSNL